jgi:hypothetical protein
VNLLSPTERRAVGGPVPMRLLAAWFAVALAAWVAGGIALVASARDLALGNPLDPVAVLAVHLVALGALPFAVAGASFHLLPVMLRNDLPSIRALWAALPLLLGGPLVAAGLERWSATLVWVGVGAVVAGLAIVAAEIGVLVWRAPRERTLIASRSGVSLSLLHAVLALVLGALAFRHDGAFWGVSYARWLLVHLHLSLVGWIALLVVAVGRSLVPMLALAPAAGRRRWPVHELVLVGGLWVLLVGLATASRPATLAGGLVVLAAVVRFGLFLARVARTRRGPIDAPLGHLLAGALFLVQGAVCGIVSASGRGGVRLVEAYVIFLLLGWAAGVVVGHVGKLLSLSIWVWWPPGPRPKQADLYPRGLALGETLAFAAGVETLALGVLAGSPGAARAGAALIAASALLAAAVAVEVWRRRP